MRLELLRNQYFSVFSTAGCPKVSFLPSFSILSASHTLLSFTLSKSLVIAQTSNLAPSNFFLNVFYFIPFPFSLCLNCSFFFHSSLIHAVTPMTRKNSDAEITVDVHKIVLTFLSFRLASLRSTGSLVFPSLNTTFLFSCCLRLEKGSSGETNYGHVKILFMRPSLYFPTKTSLISLKDPLTPL